MTALYFVAAIAFLILVHEIGHFTAAKLVGIPVQEFGIGFPPRILTLFRLKETEFTLNWIPLGGFIRPRERPGDEDIPDELFAAPPWKRIVVYLAGPMANLLAAVVILTGIIYQAGAGLEHILVTDVVPGTPAADAGIMAGDYLLAINDTPVENADQLSDAVTRSLGVDTKITLLRDEQQYSVILVPRTDHPLNEGPMGIGLTEPATLSSSLEYSVESLVYQISYYATMPVRLVGFKGMYDTFDAAVELDAIQQDIPDAANTLMFVMSISLSLGLINLIPVPLFDGGKILLAIPEMLFRKRVPINLHYALNFVGFVLVIGLMLYVNVQDFVNPVAIITPTP